MWRQTVVFDITKINFDYKLTIMVELYGIVYVKNICDKS